MFSYEKYNWLPEVWYLSCVFFTAALWQANVFTNIQGTLYVKPTQAWTAEPRSCWQLHAVQKHNSAAVIMEAHNFMFCLLYNKLSCVIEKKKKNDSVT